MVPHFLFLEQELSKKYYYTLKMYITISTTFQYQEKNLEAAKKEGMEEGRGEGMEKGRHEGSKA